MTYATLRPESPRLALAVPPPAGFPRSARRRHAQHLAGRPQASQKALRPALRARLLRRVVLVPLPPERVGQLLAQRRCARGRTAVSRRSGDARAADGDVRSCSCSQDTEWLKLPGRTQAELFGALAMAGLPSDVSIVTPVIEALHFQRGIHNFRVRDMEFEIPIPPRADDPTRPDWSICQRAWWDVIRNVYERADAPMRVALEMRIMGGSNITMAPQHGNRFGTCSIEILTNLRTPPVSGSAFMQDIANLWMSYKDPGRPAAQRPPALGQAMAGAHVPRPARDQPPSRPRIRRAHPGVPRRPARDRQAGRLHGERPTHVQQPAARRPVRRRVRVTARRARPARARRRR